MPGTDTTSQPGAWPFWRTSLATGLAAAAACAAVFLRSSGQVALDPTDYASRAEFLMKTTPLIDGHNDIPYLFRIELQNQIYNETFTFREGNSRSPCLFCFFFGFSLCICLTCRSREPHRPSADEGGPRGGAVLVGVCGMSR